MTPPCQAKAPTFLARTQEGEERARRVGASAHKDSQAGRGGPQNDREDASAVNPSHLRDSVRLKCRQSEERKSWSRSPSSSSLAPPGKAVRFLGEAGRGHDPRLPSTPPSTETAMMAREQSGSPQKEKVTLGKKTHSARPKERGPLLT